MLAVRSEELETQKSATNRLSKCNTSNPWMRSPPYIQVTTLNCPEEIVASLSHAIFQRKRNKAGRPGSKNHGQSFLPDASMDHDVWQG